MKPRFIATGQGRNIAYHHTPGAGPGVVFLGGFKSGMEGTKARIWKTGQNGWGGRFCGWTIPGMGSRPAGFWTAASATGRRTQWR